MIFATVEWFPGNGIDNNNNISDLHDTRIHKKRNEIVIELEKSLHLFSAATIGSLNQIIVFLSSHYKSLVR